MKNTKKIIAGTIQCFIALILFISLNNIWLNYYKFDTDILRRFGHYIDFEGEWLGNVLGVLLIIVFIIGILLIIQGYREKNGYVKKAIEFKNTRTGEVKEAPTGFSWTTVFFGFFPALFRSDWKWGAIQFVLSFFTFGISWIVFAFIYNKLYIKDLINKGFIPFNQEHIEYLVNNGMISSNQVDFQLNKEEEKTVQIIKKELTQTVAQQLKEFKELLDSGIITQEEFDKKKAELLK